MAKYDREEYEKIIADNALRALEAKEKDEPNRRSLKEREDIYDEYKRKLREWKDLDSMTRGYEYSLNDYNSDSLMRWLEGEKGYKAPDEYEGQSEASKILPLLKGIAHEGEDWYSIGNKKLEKTAKDLGYNTNTPGAFSEFLNLVSDYQTKYDRAELLNEFQDKGSDYWLQKLFYPSRTQEIENAILTGEGGDDATLNKLGALDAATGTAIALAPSLSLGKAGAFLGNPLVNSTIDAILQGGAEGIRQLGTERISKTGQKAELAPALLALTAGATRPGLTMTAGGAATQLPSKFGQDLARGVRRGARVGGSSERSGLQSAINLYNKDLAKAVLDSKKGVKQLVPDASGGKYTNAVKVPKIAEFFGIAPDAQGKYSAKQILNYYDANVKMPKGVEISNGEITGYKPREWSVMLNDDAFPGWPKSMVTKKPTMVLGKEEADTYRTLFQDKAADLDANRAAYVTGEILGQGAAELGGRIEPMIGTNPFKVYDNGTIQKSYTESYKNESWYKKLTDESKKIVDEAFKKKSEEQSEE